MVVAVVMVDVVYRLCKLLHWGESGVLGCPSSGKFKGYQSVAVVPRNTKIPTPCTVEGRNSWYTPGGTHTLNSS